MQVYPATMKHCDWSPVRTQAFLNSVFAKKTDYLESALKSDMSEPYDQTVSAYIVTCKPKKGQLDVQKCIELGVPPGPLLGELKNGRQVRINQAFFSTLFRVF